jgi:23S rRNA (cytidine1920-2'-O)/16S rRNA (cytidine1409-2'-O)-methyltransferase
MKRKSRLDLFIAERHPELSRAHIQSMIMQGLVTVDKKIVTKPGFQVAEDTAVEINLVQEKFVSRAGHKLEAALDAFGIDVQGYSVLDAGLSTGGFADCLLQRGAKIIYGVDVGYGQVHEKIRNDPRVVVMERTNLRHLQELPERVDLVTLDLSFISLLKVMPAVLLLMKPQAKLVTLIKPQFEAERRDIGRGGIIKDPDVHKRVVDSVVAGVESIGFKCHGIIDSPILGSSGNKEFLAYFDRKPNN